MRTAEREIGRRRRRQRGPLQHRTEGGPGLLRTPRQGRAHSSTGRWLGRGGTMGMDGKLARPLRPAEVNLLISAAVSGPLLNTVDRKSCTCAARRRAA